MSIPISMMAHLHITLSQKVAVCCIFALALFIVALDATRFAMVLINPTSMNNILIWNMVEPAIVILVANAPILRPLLFEQEYMRGGNMRGSRFLAKVVGRHRRAQSTPWSTSANGDIQYGHNRLSRQSVGDVAGSTVEKMSGERLVRYDEKGT
jgi:hypothetical protein